MVHIKEKKNLRKKQRNPSEWALVLIQPEVQHEKLDSGQTLTQDVATLPIISLSQSWRGTGRRKPQIVFNKRTARCHVKPS